MRYLELPEVYPQPPKPTLVDIHSNDRNKDVVIFAGTEKDQVLTIATRNDRPAVCDDEYAVGVPSPDRPAPKVCHADFLIVHAGQVEHIGEYRGPLPRRTDPAIDAALEPLRDAGVVDEGVTDSNVAFVLLPEGDLLMPGLVDPHSHIFNTPEQILEADGVAVGDRIMPDADFRQQALARAQEVALRAGFTSVGNLFVNQSDLSELKRFSDEGNLKVKLSLYLSYNDPGGDPVPPDHWYRSEFSGGRPEVLGDRMRLEGIKIFVDGGFEGRRALSYESHIPYGDLWFEGPSGQAELNEIVRRAQCDGIQVAFHASGDQAIPVVQNAIGNALDDPDCGSTSGNPLRHRIEHFQIVTSSFITTALENDIPVAIPFWHWVCDPHIPPEPFWDKYHDWDFLVDSGVRNGMHVAWHGDDPGFSFWHGAVAPFIELHNTVTRVEIPRTLWQGLDGGACLAPYVFRKNRITVAEALPMMTIEGAYLIHRDLRTGNLSPGKKADLIVISDDPLELEAQTDPDTIHRTSVPAFRDNRIEMVDNPIHDIRNIRVWMTMIDGRVEFCGEGHEALCWHAS